MHHGPCVENTALGKKQQNPCGHDSLGMSYKMGIQDPNAENKDRGKVWKGRLKSVTDFLPPAGEILN